jgi:hypothetical protein
MPSPTPITAADVARGNAWRTLFLNILQQGLSGASSLNGFGAPGAPGSAPVGSGSSAASLSLTADMWESALLAEQLLRESGGASPVLPLQLPVYANNAALVAAAPAATWPGGMALVTSLGAAGQPVYSDGAAWRRVDTNSTTIP